MSSSTPTPFPSKNGPKLIRKQNDTIRGEKMLVKQLEATRQGEARP